MLVDSVVAPTCLAPIRCSASDTSDMKPPEMIFFLHPATGRLYGRRDLPVRSPRTGGAGRPAASAEDRARSREEARRRAARRIHEMVHDGELRYLWSLTYAEEPATYKDMVQDIKAFGRRLRAAGVRMDRLVVPEWREEERWHLHMAVPAFIPMGVVQQAWPHGHVGTPQLDHALGEAALAKLSSYLTKSFGTTPPGVRRYLASKGLGARVEIYAAPGVEDGVARAAQRLGSDPRWVGEWGGTVAAYFDVTEPSSAPEES